MWLGEIIIGIAGWGLLILIYFGIGLLFAKAAKLLGNLNLFKLALVVWVGWAISTMVLQIWQIFLPINQITLLVLIALAIAGYVLCRKDIKQYGLSVNLRSKANLVFIGLLGLVVLILASTSLNTVSNYDSGLYHLQNIRWLENYPLPPGLGNLHLRFGFNNSNFLVVALQSAIVGFDRAVHFSSGLFMLMGISVYLITIREYVVHKKNRLEFIFSSLLLPYFGWITLTNMAPFFISSPASNTIIFIGGAILPLVVIRFLKNAQLDILFATILLVSAALVSVKLSFAVFGLTCCLIALYALSRKMGVKTIARSRKFWAVIAVASLIIIGWAIRGTIITGYPFYPFTEVYFDVPWKVPTSEAVREADWIKSWARNPGPRPEQVLGNWDWLPGWTSRMLAEHRFNFVLPVAISLIALPIIFFVRIRERWQIGKAKFRISIGAAVLAITITSSLFWFFSAPEPGFSSATFWVLASYLIAALLVRIKSERITLLLLATIIALFVNISGIGLNNLVLPFTGVKPLNQYPAVESTKLITNSGLVVTKVTDTDQCWDLELPCTPYFSDKLQLRGDDLSEGFSKQ